MKQYKWLLLVLIYSSCCKDEPKLGISNNDREFMLKANMFHHAMFVLGQDAMVASADQAIVQHAQLQDKRHTAFKLPLASFAATYNIYAPDSLDAEVLAVKLQLQQMKGRAFDSLYIMEQMNRQQQTIVVYEKEAARGNNDHIQEHASAMLPLLKQQMNSTKNIAALYP
jgi:putative membrane protein